MIEKSYNLIARIASRLIKFFPNQKVKHLVNAQQENWKRLQTFTFNSPVWFHIASSGEFEQARPVIELLKEHNLQIIVTFFSPSGFQVHKNNSLLDGVFYLPFDTQSNATKFLTIVQPAVCILVKYDFWLNYLLELENRSIPVCLISGLLSPDHFLFKWYGREHLKRLTNFACISVQNEETRQLLEKQSIHSTVTGDTRVDRSLQLPETVYENTFMQNFSKNNTTILIGSAWKEDLDLFKEIHSELIRQNVKLIIAPHELETEFLSWIKKEFHAVSLSELQNKTMDSSNANTLLIDEIGILKYAYRYADIAYIGGGFGKGIHNTLEAAAYSIPVIFGPNYKKFIEAKAMIKSGGAFTVQSKSELLHVLMDLFQSHQAKKAGEQAKQYLLNQQGASRQVADKIMQILNKYDEESAETQQ